MKTKLIMAASVAAGFILAGCNKQLDKAPCYVETPGQAELSLSLSGRMQTKATEVGSDTENAIGTVDVFVFFKGGEYDGRLDAYAHFDAAPYSLSATTGDKTIYAVVNSEYSEAVLGAVSTKDELLAKLASLSSQKDNSDKPGMFTMIGSVNRTAATSNALVAGVNSVTVNVDRLVSRVRLLKITRAFESGALAAQDFSIDEVYLSNVVTVEEYGSGHTPVADEFVNQLGVPSAAYDAWLHKDVSSSLANGASISFADASACMYAMPNLIDSDSEETPFTVRNTKLVVKATLAGKAVYYVIPLGAIRSNNTYDIGELVITRPGSSSPDKKTEIASCTFTVEVNPWTVVPIETENGKYVI
ncbi:MAG: hypothetical protein IKZ60_04845 [Bacteroidales bacterium]|nr:hypothetical protein [Bacteroidales bacterium]